MKQDSITQRGFKDMQVAVLGLGRTGLAVVSALAPLGAHLGVYDEREATQLRQPLGQVASLLEGCQLGPGSLDAVGEADLVVVSPGFDLKRTEIQRLIKQGIPVISEMELAWRLSKAPFLAVTGTNGKSTTVTLVQRALEAAGLRSRLAGNIGKAVLQDALDAGPDEVLVVEVSNYQLEAVVDFRPHWAALLNLQGDHAERQSFEEYTAIKQRIFARQTASDFAILNWDDPLVRALAGKLPATVAAFSLNPGRQVSGAWLEERRLMLAEPGGPHCLCEVDELKLRGRHNLSNALAAALLAHLAGANSEAIRQALTSFVGLDYALQFAGEVAGCTFINDSKGTNPPSTLAALASLEGPVVLVAGGKGKGADFTALGEEIARRVKALVVLGKSAPQIADAARAAGLERITFASTLEEAVRSAYEQSVAGDTVLFSPACASQDMFVDYKDRGRQFDACVRKLQQTGQGEHNGQG